MQAVSREILKKSKIFFHLHTLFMKARRFGCAHPAILLPKEVQSVAIKKRGFPCRRRRKSVNGAHRFIHMTKKRATYLFGGSAVGVANGLFGGGGGMIAVPVLKAAGRSAPSAHATAIAVILPASIASAAVYLLHGFIPLALFLPVALGVLLGGFLGAKLLARASASAVTIAFAALMLAAGLRMLF